MNVLAVLASVGGGSSGTDPLVAVAVIVVLGVGSQWLAGRLGIPSILVLLAAGLLAGPGLDLVDPDALLGDLLFPLVSLGVGILLFEGGLALRRDEVVEVGASLARLIVVGAFVTWVVAAVAIDTLFEVETSAAWLIGAVLVVSGPTVVLPILAQIDIRPASAALLKWEGILIDPVGALLAVVVLEAVLGADSAGEIVARIAVTLIGGAVVGIVMAVLLAEAIRHHWVPDRLHNAVVLMAVVGAFVLADQLQSEAGLTATTIMGVALANQRRAPVAHIAEFEEDLGVLVLGGLFILLGARVDLDAVVDFLPRSLALLAVLVLVARPLAVAAATLGSTVPVRDRLFIAAMAPRGIVAAAVASLFAIELEAEGEAVAEFVPIVFTVIVGTVIVYGLAAGRLARLLRVARAEARGVALVGAQDWVLDLGERLVDLGVPVLVVTSDPERAAAAAGRGLLVYSGRLDSEELPLAARGVGVALGLALTDSDDTNDFAVRRLSEIVGRANVFGLPAPGGHDEGGTGSSVVARRPFGSAVTRDDVAALLEGGARVRVLQRPPRGDQPWLPLVAVAADGTPRVCGDDERFRPGDQVVALVAERRGAGRFLRL